MTGQAPRRLPLRGGGKQGRRAAASMLPNPVSSAMSYRSLELRHRGGH